MTEDPSRQAPTPDQIITALDRTGFILEHRVAQTLRTSNFSTYINYAYPDSESGKSREIDVLASLELGVKRQPVDLTLLVDLVIECKSGLNPFILIGERNQSPIIIDDSVHLSFDPFDLQFKGKLHEEVRDELNLDSLPGSWRKQDFVGYQLIRMHQQNGNWRADNNSIYDSILYPLAKAWQYHVKQHQRDGEEEDDIPNWEYPGLSYVFPIIVTAGPVFIADVTEDQPQVKEVGWAGLKRVFNSTELRADLRVDVVNFAQLKSYLESRVLQIAKNAHDALKTNVHLFDPEWLLANLGDPEDKEYFDAWLSAVRAKRSGVTG